MDDKEKRDSSWDQEYAQEDWYKSNKTPEGSDSYEFGDEMVSKKQHDTTKTINNQKLNDSRNNSNKESNLSQQNLSQEQHNFEFGRDNYFNTNGTVNNHNGGVSLDSSRRQTASRLASMKEDNFADDVDFEFGNDYFAREHNDSNKKNN